ncbi:MAG: SpoIIE family protein phosphatase [Desulfobacterales bacterium]|nr:SpoIIE family protein phosphatase [Desulfobacterales bacterium]
MFISIKLRILLLFTLTMAVTAGMIMYFTHRDVRKAMFQAENTSMENVLHLALLHIDSEYKNLISNKYDTVINLKKELKNLADISASVFNEYNLLENSGVLTKEQAFEKSIQWINQRDTKRISLFVFNEIGQVISSSSFKFSYGTSISNILDIKGRPLLNLSDIAVFRFKDPNETKTTKSSKHMAYILPYEKWGCSIGAVIDIEDLESEYERKVDKIIEKLRKSFASIKVAETGSVFLFNGKKEMLVYPCGTGTEASSVGANNPSYFNTTVNYLTEHLLLDDLIQTAKSQQKTMLYKSSHINDPRIMEAHISYFKLLDWYIVVRVPVEEYDIQGKIVIKRQIEIIGFIFWCCFIIAFIFVSRITNPLKRLAKYAVELAKHDFSSADEGKSPIDYMSAIYKDEVGRLADSLSQMRLEIVKNVHHLMETRSAKERIESELSIAKEIQRGMLNKIFPAFPDRKEFDLYAVLETAKEVGGDLYDFALIDDDHLYFTLGDVSDKGVPAALFMVTTITLLRTAAQKGLSPSEMMTEVNNILSSDNPRSMFVTLIIGVLNLSTGELRYSNAGHNPPIILSKKQGVFYNKGVSGPIVAAFDGIQYKEIHLKLDVGEVLYLYTDGVTEAMNPGGELFSDGRLLSEMENQLDQNVEEIVLHVTEKVKIHADTAPQSDDIAMLVIRYNGTRKTE